MKFRSDIQGLRGLAVLAVLADHFAPDIRQTSGGFVGVDIFFVISGFLITSIITRELENNEFTLRKFWERRIRRIFPSLVSMLAISTVFIWVISSEYVKYEFLKNVAKAATFTSNFGYSQTQDYFEGQEHNALLHLWSLAIEEQFYLVWPIICLFFHKFNKNLTIYVSYSIAVVSFLANLVLVYYFESKSIAFYNTFSRVWELMIGAILAQHFQKKRYSEKSKPIWGNQLIALLGLVMIGVSLAITTEASAFPGRIALLPTLGTAAIVFAGSENFINKRLLSNRLMIWIGGISYALYLWHYPLLFLMRTISPSRTNFGLLLITFLLSILAAYLSTRFVERPLRGASVHRSSLKTLVLAMSAVFTFSILNLRMSINQSDSNFVLDRYEALGWGNQSDLDCLRLRKEITVRTLRRQGCFDAPINSDKSVFLVGDSHSASLRVGLRPFLASKEISLYGVSTGWCNWYEIKPFDDDLICAEITKEFLTSVSKAKPKVVIIAGYWAKMSRSVDTEKALIAYIQLVQSLGVEKVIVIGQVPTYDAGLPQHLQNLYVNNDVPIPKLTPRAQVENDPKGTQEHMRDFKYPPNVYFRSIDDLLCKKDLCRVTVGPNLKTDLIVWDYGHLTEAGARFVAENLLIDIERLLAD